jgi:hypothetical protein
VELEQLAWRRLGRWQWSSAGSATLVVDARIERVSGQAAWKATLAARTAGGAELGIREVIEPGEDCRALDDKLTFILALMVDPDVVSAHRDDGDQAPARLLATLPTRAPESWRFSAAIIGVGALGALPGLGLGLKPAATIQPPQLWPLEVSLTLWPDDRGTAMPGGSIFSLLTGGAALCPTLGRSKWLAGCVGAQVGQLDARGYGFDRNLEQHEWLLDLTLEAHVDWPISRSLSARLGSGAWIPLRRPHFVFAAADGHDREVYQPAIASALAEIGLTVHFH